jgi:hypothetical protein
MPSPMPLVEPVTKDTLSLRCFDGAAKVPRSDVTMFMG